MRKLYLIFAFFLLSTFSFAQKEISDSSIFIPSIGMHYGYHLSSGELANQYGNCSAIGSDFTLKFKNQLVLGLGFEYYFSDNVKNTIPYFKDIINDHGYIIDGNGQYAEVFLYQRGFNIQVFSGYQFNFLSPNPNSGPFIQIGVGLMQYRTRIENPEMTAPQVNGENKKMYDRLTNGLSITQFIGYRYLGARNLTNIYAGFEFTQGFVKNRRSYNADYSSETPLNYTATMVAFKIGWIIPLYRKAPKKYYYY
jgi:hypothetical protein